MLSSHQRILAWQNCINLRSYLQHKRVFGREVLMRRFKHFERRDKAKMKGLSKQMRQRMRTMVEGQEMRFENQMKELDEELRNMVDEVEEELRRLAKANDDDGEYSEQEQALRSLKEKLRKREMARKRGCLNLR